MKKRLRIVVPLAGVVLIVIAVGLFFRQRPGETGLAVSGNIDVTQVDLAFKIPGRLSLRLVEEGDRVTAGQRLAALDDTDTRLQLQKATADAAYAQAVVAELDAGSRLEEISRAEARVRQARFTLDELENGSRFQEIAEADADLNRANADEQTADSQLTLARSEFARYAAVFEAGGISRQTFDTYRTRLTAAENAAAAATAHRQAAEERLSLRREGSRKERIQQARAALAQAEADYALVKAGPRQETVDQARAKRDAALAALAVARQQMTDTLLVAPFSGVVLSTSAEPGSYFNTGGTVLTVADIDHVWLRAFVDEVDLGRVRLGQNAAVAIDADPARTWKGRVSYISSAAEFTPRSVQTAKERTNLVYRIKIQLDNADGTLKPGMPADAVIEVAP